MDAMMKGMVYPTVPFINRQSWQNSGGSGPYHTLNKSNPLTTDVYVANWNFNIDLRSDIKCYIFLNLPGNNNKIPTD